MGLKKLRVAAKGKPLRGAQDASVFVDMMKNNWAEIQEAFGNCTEEEKAELREHFNTAVDGQDVGIALFGDEGEQAEQDEFENKMQGLNDEEQSNFVKALRESELIADLPAD